MFAIGMVLRIASGLRCALLAHGRGTGWTSDCLPLGLIGSSISSVGSKLWNFFVLNLLGDDEVKDDGKDTSNGETGFQNKDDGVEEALKTLVITGIRKNVSEPSWNKNSANTWCKGSCEDEAVTTLLFISN
jgi:hypothetical protein